jgi:hypothetical protein
VAAATVLQDNRNTSELSRELVENRRSANILTARGTYVAAANVVEACCARAAAEIDVAAVAVVSAAEDEEDVAAEAIASSAAVVEPAMDSARVESMEVVEVEERTELATASDEADVETASVDVAAVLEEAAEVEVSSSLELSEVEASADEEDVENAAAEVVSVSLASVEAARVDDANWPAVEAAAVEDKVVEDSCSVELAEVEDNEEEASDEDEEVEKAAAELALLLLAVVPDCVDVRLASEEMARVAVLLDSAVAELLELALNDSCSAEDEREEVLNVEDARVADANEEVSASTEELEVEANAVELEALELTDDSTIVVLDACSSAEDEREEVLKVDAATLVEPKDVASASAEVEARIVELELAVDSTAVVLAACSSAADEREEVLKVEAATEVEPSDVASVVEVEASIVEL